MLAFSEIVLLAAESHIWLNSIPFYSVFCFYLSESFAHLFEIHNLYLC